jgi:hypothetical protein
VPIASSLLYSGTLKVVSWLGQRDSSGPWFNANSSLIYWQDQGASASTPPNYVPAGPGGPPIANTYLGLTWMKNVYILTRDYWDISLSSPYVGQLWPVPNTGGAQSGQTFPF